MNACCAGQNAVFLAFINNRILADSEIAVNIFQEKKWWEGKIVVIKNL